MSGILLLGGGGHCRSVLDVVRSTAMFERIGVVEAVDATPAPELEPMVVGRDPQIPLLLEVFESAFVTVGQIKSAGPRVQLFNLATSLGANLPIIVSPRAYVSPSVDLGRGSIVMHGAIVNAEARIAENCIINSMALVEHDAEVGSHTHISTGVRINGGARVGSRCFIGSGAVVRDGISIGDDCIVGAGSVVLADVAAGFELKARHD